MYALVSFSWESDSCDHKVFTTHDAAFEKMKAEYYEAAEIDPDATDAEKDEIEGDFDCAYLGENDATLTNDDFNYFWQIKEFEVEV